MLQDHASGLQYASLWQLQSTLLPVKKTLRKKTHIKKQSKDTTYLQLASGFPKLLDIILQEGPSSKLIPQKEQTHLKISLCCV